MVRFTADAATSQALGTIASYIDTQSRSKGVPVLVFNPLAWVRSGVVDFTVQLPEAAPAIEIVDEVGQVLASESSLTNAATHTFSVHALVPDVERLGYMLVYAQARRGSGSNGRGRSGQRGRAYAGEPVPAGYGRSRRPAASPAW